MESEELVFIYSSLTKKQQLDFFVYLVQCEYDVNSALECIIQEEFEHDDVDAFISPNNKMVVGQDFIETDEVDEDGDEIIENIVSIYSNRETIIKDYIKELFEDGEILTTVFKEIGGKLRHTRKLRSLNFENRPERPIIPIMYN